MVFRGIIRDRLLGGVMHKYILGDIVVYTGEKLTSEELKIIEDNPEQFKKLIKEDRKMIKLPCKSEKEAEKILNDMSNKNN